MTECFRELNWKTNFSHTGPVFKQWCKEEQGNYRYFQLSMDRVCDHFTEFSRLREALNDHGFVLYRGKFFQTNPKDFTKIHIDQSLHRPDKTTTDLVYYTSEEAMKYTEVATPVEVALNIPLLNGGEHITRWYEPEKCDVKLEAAPCGPLPHMDNNLYGNKDELIKRHCIAEHQLTTPSLIKTDIFHNVDGRHSNKLRWIISLRLRLMHENRFPTWSDLPRIQAIEF
jgi:hypothetical protein